MSRDGRRKPYQHLPHQPVIRHLLQLIEPHKDMALAIQAGVPPSWISEIRRAINRNPSIRNVQAVANVLGYELVLKPINKDSPHD